MQGHRTLKTVCTLESHILQASQAYKVSIVQPLPPMDGRDQRKIPP